MVVVTFHRSNVLLAVLSLLLIPALLQARTVFLAIGMDAEVCAVVHAFLSVRVLTLPCDVFMQSLDKTLTAMVCVIPNPNPIPNPNANPNPNTYQ